MTKYAKVFKGTGFTSFSPTEIKILKDHLFCINEKGIIQRIVSPEATDYEKILKAYNGKSNFYPLGESHYILPGFIDLHVHAPQWAQAGLALDIPLYQWLNKHTFPLESQFSNLDFAKKVYEDLVDTLLANGTTTVMYFATTHLEASLLLAEICVHKGQRGLVGKVVMDDQDQNPEIYRDASTECALADTETFILSVQALNRGTKQGVYPVVTPRFIPSCTDQALRGLGELAAKYNTYVQSHCSESDWAHNYVNERFGKHDAFALNDFGLLTEKSIMAHCNFLNHHDAELFASKGASIGHCPISNAYFANSVLPTKEMMAMKVPIVLGTDISGGFSPSMYHSIRQTVMSSRMLEDGVNPGLSPEYRGLPDSRLTIKEAFYLATASGGESLKLPIGKLEEDYAWDIQIIDVDVPRAKMPIFEKTIDLDHVFQKIMYLATPENISQVWVQGEKVSSRK